MSSTNDSDVQASKGIDERATEAFERVASTAERVGIPVATFACGAVTLFLSSQVGQTVPQLSWLGVLLIIASLGTYIWLTARSTSRVPVQATPVPEELKEVIEWMKNEISKQNEWNRDANVDKRKYGEVFLSDKI